MSSKISRILIAILIILAVAIRFYRLNDGPWLDEILTSVLYGNLSFREIASNFNSENNHILYSLLARASTMVFGQNTWALRLPAVFFGIASLGALYLLGIQVSTRREALFAVALLAFSYHHVWFSQNARGYTALLFWTLLSSWLLLRALVRNKTYTWFFYGLTAALGIYSHLTMGFVIFGQILAIFIYILKRVRRQDKAGWQGIMIGFSSLFFFTFLLFLPVLNQIGTTLTSEGQTAVAAWASPIWTLQEILRSFEIGFQSSMFILGLLIFMGAGIWSFYRSSVEFLVISLVPPVIGAIMVTSLGHHLWPRFFFFSAGFMVLILFRGVIQIVEALSRMIRIPGKYHSWLGNAALTGIVLLSALSVPSAFGPKQDYQGAYQFIQGNIQPGDAVATIGLAGFVYDRYYQSGWPSLESILELESIQPNTGNVWVVVTLPNEAKDRYPELMKKIESDFVLDRKFFGTLNDGEIFVYRSNP